MSLRSEVVRIFNELMGNAKKISELTALPSNVTTGDLIEVVRSGQNYKADGSQLPSGVGGVQSVTGDFVDNADPNNPVILREVNFVTVATAGGTLDLDFLGSVGTIFYGDNAFATAKSVTISNDSYASRFEFLIDITNIAATLDFGAGTTFESDDPRFDTASQLLTFKAVGAYTIHGTFDGLHWRLFIMDVKEPLNRIFRRETANTALVLSDADGGIEMNVGSANTVTVPLNATQAFPIGTNIPVVQYGAGLTSIVATGGVTINTSAGNLDSPGQYAPMFLRKIATNEWYLWNGTPGAGGGTVTSVGFTGGIITVANPTTTPAFTVAGTSGGVPYFNSASSWASSAALAANALVIGGGAGAAPTTITTGTGIITALGVNVGSAGAPVLFNGDGGTPSSLTLTNATGLPIAGITGLGTGWATAMATANGALFRGTSLIYPTFQSYNAPPINTTGNGQADLEFINLGNLIGNTEDRNLVPGGFYRAIGSILMSRNTVWSTANSRWEYSFSTANGYGAAWVEIGGEGVNFMAAPVGTHPYATPTGGINFSIRGAGLRSVTGYTTGYVTQTMTPFAAVYESTASGLAQWTDTGGAQPMVHLLSEEVKGTGALLGEFYRAESHGSGYGGFGFMNSNGTYGSPTNISSNKVTGCIFANAYGGAYRRTAEINFITRGTISGSAAGQSVLIRTSPDSTANLRDLFEFTYDGTVKTINAPYRITNTSVTTVPVYSSFAGFSPANTSSDLGIFQHLSTSTGGTAIYGLSTTSTASTAIALGFIGVLGATSPTAPAILFSGRKNNGSNSLTDLASTETIVEFRNNATTHVTILGNGTTTVGSAASTGVRFNTSGTIQLYNSGSAGVIGVGSSANFTYTDKPWQTTLVRLTSSPSGTASSAPTIDSTNNQIRVLVRPGSAGYMYQIATHTDTLDATHLGTTTGGLLLSHTHNPDSGGSAFNALAGTPTLNQTGTFAGSYTFIRFVPTLTAVLGALYGVVIEPVSRNGVGAGASPTAQWHIGAGTATANTAPLKFTSGTNLTAAEAGAFEYDNTLYFTQSDAARRNVVLAANATKTTAGAPYTNDGYITLRIGGTDVRFMTTA